MLLWDWRDFGTPPHAGGLFDQPAGFIRRAKYLESVYCIMDWWYSGQAQRIGKHEKEVFDYVQELRKAHGRTR